MFTLSFFIVYCSYTDTALVTPTTTVTATATYTDTALVIPTTSVPATTTDLPPTTVGIIAGIIVVLLALIATVVVILCILFIK